MNKNVIVGAIAAAAVLYGGVWGVSYALARHKVDSAKSIPAYECGTPTGNTFIQCTYGIERGFLGLPKTYPINPECCFYQ